MFIVTKRHAYTLKQFLQFLPRFGSRTRWVSPPFCKFVSVINDATLLWTTTVFSDKLDTFPRDHQNQLNKPSLMNCVMWLCKLLSLSYDLFRGFYKLEAKLVNVPNYNRKLLKWTDEFYILMTISSFKMFTWFMESKDWSGSGYFSPDLEKIKQLLVCSKHQNT